MTPADEVREARRKLSWTQQELGERLGMSPAAANAQVRKWERGAGAPSAAAMTAIRLLLALEEERRLPWMTPEMWIGAQFALEELRALAERTTARREYGAYVKAIQALRALIERRPK